MHVWYDFIPVDFNAETRLVSAFQGVHAATQKQGQKPNIGIHKLFKPVLGTPNIALGKGFLGSVLIGQRFAPVPINGSSCTLRGQLHCVQPWPSGLSARSPELSTIKTRRDCEIGSDTIPEDGFVRY